MVEPDREEIRERKGVCGGCGAPLEEVGEITTVAATSTSAVASRAGTSSGACTGTRTTRCWRGERGDVGLPTAGSKDGVPSGEPPSILPGAGDIGGRSCRVPRGLYGYRRRDARRRAFSAVHRWLTETEVGGANDTYDGTLLDRRGRDEVRLEVGTDVRVRGARPAARRPTRRLPRRTGPRQQVGSRSRRVVRGHLRHRHSRPRTDRRPGPQRGPHRRSALPRRPRAPDRRRR